MSEVNKNTPFQEKLQKRNQKIRERFNQLILEGYAKTQAYKVIQGEYGFYSYAAVQKIVRNAE